MVISTGLFYVNGGSSKYFFEKSKVWLKLKNQYYISTGTDTFLC